MFMNDRSDAKEILDQALLNAVYHPNIGTQNNERRSFAMLASEDRMEHHSLKTLTVAGLTALMLGGTTLVTAAPAQAQVRGGYTLVDGDDDLDRPRVERRVIEEDEDDLPRSRRHVMVEDDDEDRVVERRVVERRITERRIVEPVVERRVIEHRPVVRHVIERPIVRTVVRPVVQQVVYAPAPVVRKRVVIRQAPVYHTQRVVYRAAPVVRERVVYR
jgi:hypothetical protein